MAEGELLLSIPDTDRGFKGDRDYYNSIFRHVSGMTFDKAMMYFAALVCPDIMEYSYSIAHRGFFWEIKRAKNTEMS